MCKAVHSKCHWCTGSRVKFVNCPKHGNFTAIMPKKCRENLVLEAGFLPATLCDAILRTVKDLPFSNELVTKIYNSFENDFFEGEQVICTLNAVQSEGVIHDKTIHFPGQIRSISMYTIRGTFGKRVKLPAECINRAPKVFTLDKVRALLEWVEKKGEIEVEKWCDCAASKEN